MILTCPTCTNQIRCSGTLVGQSVTCSKCLELVAAQPSSRKRSKTVATPDPESSGPEVKSNRQLFLIGGIGIGAFLLASFCFISIVWYAATQSPNPKQAVNSPPAQAIVADAKKPSPQPQAAEAPQVPVQQPAAPIQEPVAPMPEKVVPPAKDWDGYLSPDQVANIDGIKIELLAGRIGKIRLVNTIGSSEYDSRDEYLQIKVRITNSTETFRLEYLPWRSGDFGSKTRMVDEFNNEHRPYGRLIKIKGGLSYAKVDPGKSVEDIIAFDAPLPIAKIFTVHLSSSNIQKFGKDITYKIPRSWLESKQADAVQVKPDAVEATLPPPKVTKPVQGGFSAGGVTGVLGAGGGPAPLPKIMQQPFENQPVAPVGPVTRANYDKIATGTRLVDTQTLLGPGRLAVQNVGFFVMVWQSQGFNPTVIRLTFQNSRVTAKEIFGP